jgi:type I restriction enzyme S subunit
MTSNLKNVPPNWQKVRFDEIAQIVTDRIEKPVESGLSDYIGLEHLDTDCIRIKRFGSTEDVDATKFLCKKGDIIFGKRRAYLRKLAVSDREAVVSAHSMVLRPTGDKIYPDFLPCFMQSSIFWKTAHSISEGSMSPTIKWKTLAAQEFWLPSIEEQKKISELLWSIEDNIQKTEKLIETIEILKQGLLNELLTKGIGHTRFKDSELGRIPEEWEVKKIKDFCDVKTGTTPSTENQAYWNGNIRWMSSGEINKKFIYDTEKKITEEAVQNSNLKTHPTNSVMIALNGQGKTRGSVAIIKVPTTCNQSLACLIPDEHLADYLYIYYNLQNRYLEIRNYTGNNGREGLNLTIVKNIKIALPPLEEQNRIRNIFNLLDNSIQRNYENIAKFSSIRKKLSNKLILGDLITEL